MKTLYADGLVRAPVSGTIGPSVPSVGDVYRPGDPLLTVYFGEPYILLYLPRRYLFPAYAGMKLEVTDGQNTASGVISETLPVTDALPKEFQNTYKPSDRNQLAKIKLEPSTTVFPLLQKVRVTRPLLQLLAASSWTSIFGGPEVSGAGTAVIDGPCARQPDACASQGEKSFPAKQADASRGVYRQP